MPTPRTHIIATTFTPDEEDAEELELLIYYTYTPGQPERGPTYACGGTPAEPAEVELDHVEFADGRAAPEFEEWAARYLQQAGYDDACGQKPASPNFFQMGVNEFKNIGKTRADDLLQSFSRIGVAFSCFDFLCFFKRNF